MRIGVGLPIISVSSAIHVLGLGLGRAEEVTVVVVADVLLIEFWETAELPLQWVRAAHVPVGDQVVAIRIGVHEQDDDIIEQAQGFFIIAAHELIDRLTQLLCAQ
jgi:hypothetical protein